MILLNKLYSENNTKYFSEKREHHSYAQFTLNMCKNEECLSGKNTELHYGISKKKIQQTNPAMGFFATQLQDKTHEKMLPGMLCRTKMLVVVRMPIPLAIMNTC